MFISSLANQINSNLDNIVVGAYLGSSEVAVYSVALTIFGMFSQIGSAVSGVMLPKVTGLLREKDNNIENYVVKIGRIQFMHYRSGSWSIYCSRQIFYFCLDGRQPYI